MPNIDTLRFQLGSISTGTLRTQDLLKAFAIEAEARCGDMATRAVSAARIYLDPDAIVDDEQTQETLEELRFLLEDSCPPFVHFGTLEGDGADFGFWPDMDRLNEEIQWVKQTPASDEVVLWDDDNDPNNPIIVHVSDHGNVTVMDMERNVIWSVV